MDAQTTILYRPVGAKELELIAASGWREFPPRFSWQPIFYPVLNEAYAVQIARDWNTKDEASGFVGHVLRFQVDTAFLARYDVRIVGGGEHAEYWIPDLPAFNAHIIGTIDLVRTFGQQQDTQR